MTLGEKRVRLTFNPGQSGPVDEIKRMAAAFIDRCNDIVKSGGDPEQIRCASLAMTHIEDAAMWAVKAVTYDPTHHS